MGRKLIILHGGDTCTTIEKAYFIRFANAVGWEKLAAYYLNNTSLTEMSKYFHLATCAP